MLGGCGTAATNISAYARLLGDMLFQNIDSLGIDPPRDPSRSHPTGWRREAAEGWRKRGRYRDALGAVCLRKMLKKKPRRCSTSGRKVRPIPIVPDLLLRGSGLKRRPISISPDARVPRGAAGPVGVLRTPTGKSAGLAKFSAFRRCARRARDRSSCSD